MIPHLWNKFSWTFHKKSMSETCPHRTCFGSKYPKNGVGLAVTLEKNFNFSKFLLSPKFNNNSIIIEVKKKILYYIVYHTLEWNIDPIKSKVKYVVDIFFSSLPYSLNYAWILGIIKLLKIWNFCPKWLPTLPHFWQDLGLQIAFFIYSSVWVETTSSSSVWQ